MGRPTQSEKNTISDLAALTKKVNQQNEDLRQRLEGLDLKDLESQYLELGEGEVNSSDLEIWESVPGSTENPSDLALLEAYAQLYDECYRSASDRRKLEDQWRNSTPVSPQHHSRRRHKR